MLHILLIKLNLNGRPSLNNNSKIKIRTLRASQVIRKTLGATKAIRKILGVIRT